MLVFMLTLLTVFLAGVLFIAVSMELRHGDTNASYPIFAVRDSLIEAVVFERLDRDDPWVESLYCSINNLLRNSHAVAGPGVGWARANWFGTLMGAHPQYAEKFPQLPLGEEPPEGIKPILTQLDAALFQFLHRHRGMQMQLHAAAREHFRQQRRVAKEMQSQIRQACELMPA